MAPLPTPKLSFDIIAIGGGTAGSGVIRYASRYGKKAAVVELKKGYGGTCVQVGCVPKKLMWIVTSTLEAAQGILGEEASRALKDADGRLKGGFGWERIKTLRDAEVQRQQDIVKANFAREGITRIQGRARLVSADLVEVTPTDDAGQPNGDEPYTISAPHVALTLGGTPVVPSEGDVPGASLGITSDGFFALKRQPKRLLVCGAGYIACELSQVMNALGTKTHVAIRGDKLLRTFDPLIQDTITNEMEAKGIQIHKQTHIKSIQRSPEDSTVLLATLIVGPNKDEQTLKVDQVLFAIGRKAMTKDIGLEALGVEMNVKGDIQTDVFEQTTVEGVYAVGDCTGKRLLTPVALAAGRRLSGRLFGPAHPRDLKLDYDFIPSVIFSHPPVGSVGLTEAEAKEAHGAVNVRCFSTAFGALPYKMMELAESEQPTKFKVVCVGEKERVVGLHLVGGGADEMLQGFAVAIKMGVTMRDFLDTVALHPTSAEEIVTITPPF